MEFVEIFKRLREHAVLVGVVALVALAAAVAVALRGETREGGTASAEILVDARESALGDLRKETLPLVARSAIFARLLGADGATEAIAREAGLRPNEVTVVGPQLRVDGVPDQASAERATQLAQGADRLVQVQQGDDLPLLTIFTTAPTREEAAALANSTAQALDQYVSDYQQREAIPERRRVEIRQLGEARSSEFRESQSPLLPIGAFVFLFGLGCLAILIWPRIREAWSEQEPQPAATDRLIVIRDPRHANGNGGSDPERGRSVQRALSAIGLLPPGDGLESDRSPDGNGSAERAGDESDPSDARRPAGR